MLFKYSINLWSINDVITPKNNEAVTVHGWLVLTTKDHLWLFLTMNAERLSADRNSRDSVMRVEEAKSSEQHEELLSLRNSTLLVFESSINDQNMMGNPSLSRSSRVLHERKTTTTIATTTKESNTTPPQPSPHIRRMTSRSSVPTPPRSRMRSASPALRRSTSDSVTMTFSDRSANRGKLAGKVLSTTSLSPMRPKTSKRTKEADISNPPRRITSPRGTPMINDQQKAMIPRTVIIANNSLLGDFARPPPVQDERPRISPVFGDNQKTMRRLRSNIIADAGLDGESHPKAQTKEDNSRSSPVLLDDRHTTKRPLSKSDTDRLKAFSGDARSKAPTKDGPPTRSRTRECQKSNSHHVNSRDDTGLDFTLGRHRSPHRTGSLPLKSPRIRDHCGNGRLRLEGGSDKRRERSRTPNPSDRNSNVALKEISFTKDAPSDRRQSNIEKSNIESVHSNESEEDRAERRRHRQLMDEKRRAEDARRKLDAERKLLSIQSDNRVKSDASLNSNLRYALSSTSMSDTMSERIQGKSISMSDSGSSGRGQRTTIPMNNSASGGWGQHASFSASDSSSSGRGGPLSGLNREHRGDGHDGGKTRSGSLTTDDLYGFMKAASFVDSASTLESTPNSSKSSILKEGKYSQGHSSMSTLEKGRLPRHHLLSNRKAFHMSFEDVNHRKAQQMKKAQVTFLNTTTVISIPESQSYARPPLGSTIPPSKAPHSRVRHHPEEEDYYSRPRGHTPYYFEAEDAEQYRAGRPVAQKSLDDLALRKFSHSLPPRKFDGATRPLSKEEGDKYNPRDPKFEGGPFELSKKEEETILRRMGAMTREAHLQQEEEDKLSSAAIPPTKPTGGLKKLFGFVNKPPIKEVEVPLPQLTHNQARLAAANAAFASVQ
jgi:hypothetical protein